MGLVSGPDAELLAYMVLKTLSNRAFHSYDAILDAACEDWHSLMAVVVPASRLRLRCRSISCRRTSPIELAP